MKRLYTFGCSFTQYNWPTWADIAGREFDHFENWGRNGGGNHLILYSLSECILKNQLGSDDLVIIMWTNVAREDRYVNDYWLSPGNIYTQNLYDKKFVKNFADEKGYLITNLAVIYAAKKLLEQYNIPHIFTSMVEINNIDQYDVSVIKDADNILNLYKDILDFIRPSIFDTIFNQTWKLRNFELTPFLESKLENRYNLFVGANWPNFDRFKVRDFVGISENILVEMEEVKIEQWEQWKEWVKVKDRNITFEDLHALPIEYLHYIETVMPELYISNKTKEWTTTVNTRLLNNQKFNDLWNDQQSLGQRW